jgi:hydroxymethylglutaryl-CoA reductase
MSRLPGFYQKSIADRVAELAALTGLSPEAQAALAMGGLTAEQADHMIENVVGVFALPLAVAANFVVNGREVLVPMVVEEPSIVASASFMAKLARDGGGFKATSTEPEMIGQLQVLDVADLAGARARVAAAETELLAVAGTVNPSIVGRGGGARAIEARVIDESPIGPFLVVHIVYDTRDAMGANAINTVCEAIAPRLEALTGGRVHLRILSNFSDRRRASARCRIPVASLAFGDFSGERVRDGVIEAYAFAAADPYRAATHNKGILNGIDPVVIATGNDWRAIEAGAHAYAARSGRYTSLSTWRQAENGDLEGELDLPLAVGIVGGATKVHPLAQTALKILGVHSARELAEILAAVGLAQNLGALRALATEGIQRGHMSLHARQIAVAAGATGDQVEAVAARLVAEGQVRVERAREILKDV